MTEETLSFEAEVSRLLDIVANALYSNKEIFLRELISNASDACDRLRYAALTDPALTEGQGAGAGDFAIDIALDKKAKTLTLADNGIGMNRDELIANLGTIARSGTAAFVESLKGIEESEKKGAVNQIGQFGVGFYSAFMVADKVEVFSRRAGENQGWHWVSDGKGSFTVSESDDAPGRGTRILLHLKKEGEEFLEPQRIEKVVRTYSDHIAVPIRLQDEKAEGGWRTLNQASALWTRPKSEITDEQYREFYHHVGHGFDDPWLRLHFKAEGVLEYAGLLYIPSTKPFDLFHPDRKHRVKLYVKRVFITDDCPELVPAYLRFLTGVIDSEDLPLSISREMLQHNPLLTKIRQAVAKRVLGELEKKASKAPEDYAVFWRNFGAVLKEGLYEDSGQKEKILKLSRFASTRNAASGGDDLVSLEDYVAAMKPGQESIYYIAGEDAAALRRSPQLEGFAAKGVEVLFMTDPVDEFWLGSVGEFEGKPFRSVTRGTAELSRIGKEAKDQSKDEQGEDKQEESGEDKPAHFEALLAFLRLTLKDSVKDVRGSDRLTESAVCLVADEGDMDIHLERLLKAHKQLEQSLPRILEVNPQHPLVRRLSEKVGQNGSNAELEEVAQVLLDQARILEGEPLPDPAAYARRVASLVEKGLAA